MSGPARPGGLIVIAGGGTAGHALPAVAVGRALVARGHLPEDVLFVGSRRGLEARLVPQAGFPIVLLPGRGIVRRLTPGAMAQNVVSLAGLMVAAARAAWLIVRRRPSVVLSVGGYAGVPCAVAAVLLRAPLVLAESNGVAGAANRLVGRWARAAAVAFPGTGLPREVVTGNPVRPEILQADASPAGRTAARQALGLPPDRLVLAVTGGSLGARRINEAILALVERWADRDDLAIHHVVGARDWLDVSSRRPSLPPGGLHYQAVEYEDRMPDVLVAADVVLCRAGGTTLAELTDLGVPAILVPLPNAPDDHQTVGARQLADAGGAVLIPDGELTAE
ncbi:MAG TPA: UDP-N-acetylglucosamine--N-acetylmuramyl-(pentapeptide) pyrophosphoryl-undecaprenol N-acetylglucosamine transferase, partial [Acidimicrobiales bacterium]|nr:UDP-N-acetylglucosamine--N-acetylmuramyl-(pentapeptide) pyrophosphoryl-undecaprenol N-acetylglucosamine transferase [Acidimicrobiales bacterium]